MATLDVRDTVISLLGGSISVSHGGDTYTVPVCKFADKDGKGTPCVALSFAESDAGIADIGAAAREHIGVLSVHILDGQHGSDSRVKAVADKVYNVLKEHVNDQDSYTTLQYRGWHNANKQDATEKQTYFHRVLSYEAYLLE